MPMNPAVISALAAVGGSSVGAMAPVLTAYIVQRGQIQRDVLNRHIAQRETLYSDFITQASRLYADSIGHSLGKLDDVVALYALVDRIRLLASPMVFRAADEMVRRIVRQYGEPNQTPEQIRENALTSKVNPLGEFSSACRKEFDDLLQHGGIPRNGSA
jgi:vacuolar-type H+-ATPase subunit B/Vma2